MVSKIFNNEFDEMVGMTLNELWAEVKVIHFCTNGFLTYDFLGL